MFKKGQGISINMVVVAAVALIVLVVVVLIFTGRLGIFTKGTAQVTDKTCNQYTGADGSPGIWLPGTTCPEGYAQKIFAADAPQNEGKICCVPSQ